MKKIFNKNNLILLVISIISMILFHLSNTYQILGRLIDNFYPCIQEIGDSFPCYAFIDIWAMIILIVIGFGSLFVLLFNILSIYSKK